MAMTIFFGNDVSMDDIIWMGKQPTIKEQALKAGVSRSAPLKDIGLIINASKNSGRKIHYLPPYRSEILILVSGLLNIPMSEIRANASADLIKAVVKLRMKKDELEVKEIEKMVDVAYIMHTTGNENGQTRDCRKRDCGSH